MSKTIISASVLAFGLLFGSAGFATGAQASVPTVESSGYTELMAEGEALWEQGQLVEAAVRFRQAADLDPQSVEARMKLGGVYVADQKFGDGRDAFQEAIGIDPTNADAFVALGISYLHSGSGPALAAFNEALRLDPGLFKKLDPIITRIEDKQRRMAPHALSENNAPGHP